MSDKINMAVSSERLLGAELVRAAEGLLSDTEAESLDPAVSLQLATAQLLLALYWELRHQEPEAAGVDRFADPPWSGHDSSLEWLTALLCSGLATVDPPAAA